MASQVALTQTPYFLTILLNRFSMTGAAKIATVVKAPDYLEVGEDRFELCSVIEHIGQSPTSGHYIAHSNLGGWFECNDTQITSYEGQRAAQSRNAYGFMYRKCTVMEARGADNTFSDEERKEEADTVSVGNITDCPDMVLTIDSEEKESETEVDKSIVGISTDEEDTPIHSDIAETVDSEEVGNITPFSCSDIDPEIQSSDDNNITLDDQKSSETETTVPEHGYFKY